MNSLVALIRGASKTRANNDDDFADRLSSRYTVVLLVTFAVLVTFTGWWRNPMTCWAPAHFQGGHTKFATSYCWIKNTYYVPWEDKVPINPEEKRQTVTYYQWIPIILLFQAFLFYAPTIVWHTLNKKSGVDADDILQVAGSLNKTDSVEAHDHKLGLLVKTIDRFLGTRQDNERNSCGVRCVLRVFSCGHFSRRLSSYLVIIFIISKLFYLANVIGQLFLLNVVLKTNYNTFGIDMMSDMANRDDWTEHTYVAFPRVTYCDFKIRGQDLGNTQSYTVQCVLPFNMINEKIYLFLWFWMCFVAAASVVSLVQWILRAAVQSDRIRFITNHLHSGERIPSGGEFYSGELIRKFTTDYLRQDGAFTLRLIAHNTDNINTTEIICGLWYLWKENNAVSSESYRRLYPDAVNAIDTIDKRKLAAV